MTFEPRKDYIHGSTRGDEVARLEKQARFVAPWSLARFHAEPGMQVLDLGTGIGAMARELALRYPGIVLTGVDCSLSQLEIARVRHPVAHYEQADVSQLPFDEHHFDRVHASWLLEHIAEPLPVALEARRVLKPGGTLHLVEVDNRTLKLEPKLDHVEEVWNALNDAQFAAGGNPFIGASLGQLLQDAGFSRVDIDSPILLGDASDHAFYQALITEFADIFHSIRPALGAKWQGRIDRAVAELEAFPSVKNSNLRYTPVIARAVR